MTLTELRNEINRLELSGKLLLVEDIWDSISSNNIKLPLTESKKKELDARYTKFLQGKLELCDWQTVHEDLRNKYK